MKIIIPDVITYVETLNKRKKDVLKTRTYQRKHLFFDTKKLRIRSDFFF